MIILTRRLTKFKFSETNTVKYLTLSGYRLFQFHHSISIISVVTVKTPCRPESKFEVGGRTHMLWATSVTKLNTALIPKLEGISMKRTSFKLCSLAF